ncbi:murein hydrolase activator EnvC family protein [Sphingomonas rubra]|uniref:murein hydrolase activator EnvC family protein n=1 Tax=Sphingomonas rubra TaxID=634430 RepID=UPI000B82FAA7|nr:peptidoglycan DD-metalloendopeptidase family protein [Sphingomonas rubra]
MKRALTILSLFVLVGQAAGQSAGQVPTLAERRASLDETERAAAIASARAEQLLVAAERERAAAARAAADERALAARVAASVAELAAAGARAALIDRLLAEQRARLAEQRAPVAQLLAALQSLAARPAIVAAVQPGSVDDLVHLRAVLGSALPVIEARTAEVRADLARTRQLRWRASLAARALQEGRARLEADRVALAAVEARHRDRAAALGRDALSAGDRALAMGERARDLVDLMADDDAEVATAGELAQLPGPIGRPLAPGSVVPPAPRGLYRLPVQGRVVTGFGELADGGYRARGLTLAVLAGAPVTAPAAGVVRYARRFRGYRGIVVIDHGEGWVSLLTGLEQASVRPGDRVAAGQRIGSAGRDEQPRVTVELRRRGRPIDAAALIG